jgi:hypothetical protein
MTKAERGVQLVYQLERTLAHYERKAPADHATAADEDATALRILLGRLFGLLGTGSLTSVDMDRVTDVIRKSLREVRPL